MLFPTKSLPFPEVKSVRVCTWGRTSTTGMCAMGGLGHLRTSSDVCHSKVGDSPAGVLPPPGQRLSDSQAGQQSASLKDRLSQAPFSFSWLYKSIKD